MKSSRLITLGGFSFSANGTPTPCPATRKARALLAYLIMKRGVDCSRERLFEVFWPEIDLDRARDNLSTALHSIRRSVRSAGADANDFLLASKSVVRWVADTTFDADEFTELASRNDPDSGRKALELYRGDFLEGDYDDWAVSERERLSRLYEAALATVVRSTKDPDAAHAVVARNPFDEDAYIAIVESELAAGHRSSAAAWVERYRLALYEIGERPSTAFEERFDRIIRFTPTPRNEVTLPFAGRESELEALAERFGGAGGVTIVHGVAGIGKSALLARAAQMASARGLNIFTIQCGDETTEPFGPWKRLFGSLCGGDFEAFVRRHSSNLTSSVAEEIASRLTERSALIVDDLHSAASESLDIFLAIGRQLIARNPVVAAVRPEGLPLLRQRLQGVPFDELEVDRLDRADLRSALAQALGSDQPETFDPLYGRSDGHPMFFVGLLKSLVDTGTLARVDYRWQLTKPINVKLELPETVRRFIQMRVRARGECARGVACALALEPAATADDLAAVLRFDEGTTLDALDDLLSLGVIYQPSSGPQFAFTHDLMREVSALELNVGRRTSLHKAFANRFEANGKRHTALRLAHHLQAAGEPMPAARAYLEAAGEALELGAAREAIERCEAGVREAGSLTRTCDRDVLLAGLYRTAARAAIACGLASESIERGRQSLASARSSGDLSQSARAALDLAVIDGAMLHTVDQQADAALAWQGAQRCRDRAIEAQARVQQAMAARELGLRDEALQFGRAAYRIAVECGAAKIALSALEELLRSQATWWLFKDGGETARMARDVARLEEPLPQASFRLARSILLYASQRLDHAKEDLVSALELIAESALQPGAALVSPIYAQPLLQFGCHYMLGKIAAAQGNYSAAIEASGRAATLTTVASLPSYGQALALLRIDALLMRGGPDDDTEANDALLTLVEREPICGMLGWSDCVELAMARTAVRLGSHDASSRLRLALDVLEDRAHVALLDADLAFERLAAAASEADEPIVGLRARARAKSYRLLRRDGIIASQATP